MGHYFLIYDPVRIKKSRWAYSSALWFSILLSIRSETSKKKLHWRDDKFGTFLGVFTVQSHALLLLPPCFFGLPHLTFALKWRCITSSLPRQMLNNEEEIFHKHFLCYICVKHFTVQKCWKLWSSFLLLFKEKINAVITSVTFPSWKHGHEIRFLGFHSDGGMVLRCWDGLDYMSMCQTCGKLHLASKKSKSQTARGVSTAKRHRLYTDI